MAKTFTAPFAQTTQTGVASVTNTAQTLLVTAGADGALLTRLSAMPAGTVTASRLSVYISKDSGVTKHVIEALNLAAYTNSTSVAAVKTDFTMINKDTPIRLEAGDRIYVSSDVAQAAGVVFFAEWSDF